MKCLILAGGIGERLWPLSRRNCPKQFIPIQKDHSIFQETVIRNMRYCDSFVISCAYEHRYLVESQMSALRGVAYTCSYEQQPIRTAAAIAMVCMDLPSTGLLFVVASNHLLDISENDAQGDEYQKAVLQAKVLARDGKLVVFGLNKENANQNMGFIQTSGEMVTDFVEKPQLSHFYAICRDASYLRNSGMYLFQAGAYLNELRRIAPDFYHVCAVMHRSRKYDTDGAIYDPQGQMKTDSVEKVVLEHSDKLAVVPASFGWKAITSLEDIELTDFRQRGFSVKTNCVTSKVINSSLNQVVVVDGIEDAIIVNTEDAVFIGRYGKTDDVKKTLARHNELKPFYEKSRLFYRTWGFYEQLVESTSYRVRRVTLYPGKRIYPHLHLKRSENWTIVSGEAMISLDGVERVCGVRSNIDVPFGVVHQIANPGSENVVFIETAVGDIGHETDTVASDAAAISIRTEAFVRLRPAYKDSLWGGTRLQEHYGKECDLDCIAESWECSAHPAGQSIVDSGRCKGMPLAAYLKVIGLEGLGWKLPPGSGFPLMVKFIDAHEDLSVQVHPDDEYALEHEHDFGKNEMWYVVDCEPNACIYIGFKRDVTREEVERRVRDNTILEILNRVETRPGDAFFIPAGTVHSIGKGNFIYEVQQSSDIIYRLYDFGRRDKFGNQRELHLNKALEISNYERYEPQFLGREALESGTVLCRCKYFESQLYEIDDHYDLNIDVSHFAALTCIEGEGLIYSDDIRETIKAGDSFFIQAGRRVSLQGKCKIIVSCI